MKYDLKNLTLEEKMRLLTGKNYWLLETANGKLPEVYLSDGPHGLRMHDKETFAVLPAVAYPTLSVVANSWDSEIAFLEGQSIADVCIEHGADVLLAPGVNVKRTPLCGRNFEYFSEDPFLAGTLAKAYIEGVQSKGVGTSLKHYCGNNREYDRYYQSSEVDERTLREIYLPAFEIALQAKPWTVMCAYNPVNGVYASENKWIFDILRKDFGFDGVIVSDWESVRSSWRAAKAGLDLRMPYKDCAYDEIKYGYDNGLLTEEEIDARVEKILALMEKKETAQKKVEWTNEERHARAVTIAKAGMVLLKNDGVLPLTGGKILVGGPLANNPSIGGGGSAFVTTEYKPRPLTEELSNRIQGGQVCEYPRVEVDANLYMHHIAKFYIEASRADTVVLCMGTNYFMEGEDFDRITLRLTPTQEDLILHTAKRNKRVVVVLQAGSAIDTTAWINEVSAVLYTGYAGEGMQEAIADLLTGKACPMGKPAETFPLCLEDTPTGKFHGDGFTDRYAEGVFVGYRYYDSYGKEVLFPFGHGLSYAKFEYADLCVKKESETDYLVSYTVKNISNIDGAEISQVYIRDPFATVSRPEKELKGFAKTPLKAGESKRVEVRLNARSFAFYSVPRQGWYVENGEFEILVGASSRDIRLQKQIVIKLPEGEQFSSIEADR